MALKLEAVGKTTPPMAFDYEWKDAVLYALGVGAQASELDFLYEKRGPKVLPTFAVVPAFVANHALFELIGGDLMGVVHGGQTIRLHKPFAPRGRLTTIGRVAGLYDLKRMAQSITTTETRDEHGDLVCESEWSIIYRFDGGFGGPTPPKREKVSLPDRAPDFRVEQPTSVEQALLYRLSGDLNPLHADPEVAQKVGFDRPLLHGLCTYGIVGRALMTTVCAGDPSRLAKLAGQFSKPVFPGDTLVTEGFRDGDRVLLRVTTLENPGEIVFNNAYAEVR